MRTFRLRKFELSKSEPTTSFVTPSKRVEGVARVRRKRLSWMVPSDSAVKGHRVYWEINGNVDYNSQFAEVGKATDLVLPDEIPSFPLATGRMEIGITSISGSGNESDMVVMSAFFDFSRPEAPVNVKLENVERDTW